MFTQQSPEIIKSNMAVLTRHAEEVTTLEQTQDYQKKLGFVLNSEIINSRCQYKMSSVLA